MERILEEFWSLENNSITISVWSLINKLNEINVKIIRSVLGSRKLWTLRGHSHWSATPYFHSDFRKGTSKKYKDFVDIGL